jgi:hypothetical protein
MDGEGLSRNHPLEGRGLRAAFFQFLQRSSAGSSSPEIAIPDTVAFEHGYPRWWYQYDSKSKEVRRSAGGKDLHAASILDYFIGRAPKVGSKPLGVVASYTYVVDASETDSAVAVEYHTPDSLQKFLANANDGKKKMGILQALVLPMEIYYTVISAMWCPTVSVVRRRASKRMLTETRSPLLDRFVTFDGPEYHSSEVHCAVETKEKVLDACKRIADHLQRSLHIRISSFQAYFVIARNGEPVMLWSGAFFVASPHAAGPGPTVPPTLMAAPAFAPPVAGFSVVSEPVDQLLAATDRAQREVEASMSPRASSPGHDGKDGRPGALGDNNAAGSAAAAAARQRKQRADEASLLADRVYAQWFLVSKEVQAEYESLLERERAAVLHVSDVLYAAHSCFLAPQGAAPASIEVPVDLSRCLGATEAVAELLSEVGLNREGDTTSRVLVAPPSERLRSPVTMHPVPKLIADAERWLSAFFSEKRRLLRLRCNGAIEQAVVRAVTSRFLQGLDVDAAVAAAR